MSLLSTCTCESQVKYYLVLQLNMRRRAALVPVDWPQIPHCLPWDWIRVYVLISRWQKSRLWSGLNYTHNQAEVTVYKHESVEGWQW